MTTAQWLQVYGLMTLVIGTVVAMVVVVRTMHPPRSTDPAPPGPLPTAVRLVGGRPFDWRCDDTWLAGPIDHEVERWFSER